MEAIETRLTTNAVCPAIARQSASARESANVTPCIGCCSIPSMCVAIGMPAMSRIVGPMSIASVK